ncbi:MAG: sigma-70 family RNA polymerase sigma factor [Gemmatimonadaceae bacterium]|nr:sigma-70 family RNA polymerase sigma factor [Gemmatimonadaceae bacterium]
MPQQGEPDVCDERALIDGAAAGSSEALARLFDLYSAQVHLVAYRLTMSADDAEDLVQDVFIGLPEALAAYSRQGAFAGWLRAVTVRATLMRMRAGRRRAATALRAGAVGRTTPADGAIDRLALEGALSALPSDLRVVFMLADVEGYRHAEIGKLLGIRTGTSEVRLHRARRKLRALLGER